MGVGTFQKIAQRHGCAKSYSRRARHPPWATLWANSASWTKFHLERSWQKVWTNSRLSSSNVVCVKTVKRATKTHASPKRHFSRCQNARHVCSPKREKVWKRRVISPPGPPGCPPQTMRHFPIPIGSQPPSKEVWGPRFRREISDALHANCHPHPSNFRERSNEPGFSFLARLSPKIAETFLSKA